MLFIVEALVAAFVVLTIALKQQGKARRGWLLIGLGIASQFFGNNIAAYLEVVAKTAPFPSPADFFFLIYGPVLLAGLLQLMPPLRDRLEGSRLALDLAITVGAIGLFFWRFLLALPLTWGMTPWATSIILAYPLLDLLLLGLLLLMVMQKQHGEPPRLELLVMGVAIAAQVAGDLFYNAAITAGTYYTGHPQNSLWIISTALVVLAAYASLRQQRASLAQSVATLNGYFAVVVPYLAVASGFGLLAITPRNPEMHDMPVTQGVFYGSVGTTFLVILRQLLAFNENRRLTKDLARQSETLKEQSETLAQYSETLEVRVQERTAELEALSRRFRHDALHDALTGLPNRAHFQKELRRVVEHNHTFAALYLDFDRFKAVNDSYGHAVGDALLKAIGERLGPCLRPGDLVARLGGDEFALLLRNVNHMEGVVQVAERITKVFRTPMQLGPHTPTAL